MAPIGRRGLAAAIPAFLLAGLLVLVAAPNSPASPDLFVTMPDGVQIAVGLHMPTNFDPRNPGATTYPTIFEFSGYDGASAESGTLSKQYGGDNAPLGGDSSQLTDRWNDNYVIVHASVRGTGCSGGEFDLFGTQNGIDGRYIVDQWIPKQPWSNGDVAIVGHSYSGITGFQVASTPPAQNVPSHLRAVSVSGLIDDVYRGIVYPGGVQDYGFPLLWTGAIRPVYDVGGGLLPGLVRSPNDDFDHGNYPDDSNRQQECAQNATTKSRATTNDPLVQGLASTDNDWYRSRSLINYADKITVPLHITGAYQDEQTGPRGPTHLWQAAVNTPEKRLLLVNGNHDSQNPGLTGREVWQDRKDFIDHYMLGTGKRYPRTSVTVLWDWHRDASGELIANARTDATGWPLPGTAFTDWNLQPDGKLAPGGPTGSATYQYVTGSPRQSWSYQAGPTAGSPVTTADGPDQVVFSSDPLQSGLAIHGPMTATLWLSSTATDTDMFVEVADDAPDGSRTFLQRGMLKASHQAIDYARSDYFEKPDHTKVLYRPWRPHINPQSITPGAVNEYLIEIFPVGHIFRPGHKLTVIVHAPPLVDSYYAYGPNRAPAGVNTIYVDAQHPSRIMVPEVAMPSPRDRTFDPKCGQLEAVRCVPAS